MILKIRRSMSHADALRGVPSFLYIDGITSLDVSEARLKRQLESDGLMVTDVSEHPIRPESFSYEDIIWSDENCGEEYFCRAVVNISRDDFGEKSRNRVYYFATEAFLMNDNGATVERLSPSR